MVMAPNKWWDRLKRSQFTSCTLGPCAVVLIIQNNDRSVTGILVDELLERNDEVLDNSGSQAWV